MVVVILLSGRRMTETQPQDNSLLLLFIEGKIDSESCKVHRGQSACRLRNSDEGEQNKQAKRKGKGRGGEGEGRWDE